MRCYFPRMTLDIVRIRDKQTPHGIFRIAEIQNHEAASASWWTFDDEQGVRDRWWKPQAGDVVLDIGAAFGSYALPALLAGARVICFSPAEFDTELLEKNLSLNPTLAERCTVERVGLYSADGWFDPKHCTFRAGLGNDFPGHCEHCLDGRNSSLMSKYGGNCPACGCTAPHGLEWLFVRSLDSLFDGATTVAINWMKLDVEGAELEVLRGAERCIRHFRPNILVENHEFHIPGIAQQVRDFLIGLDVGYRCEGPEPHGSVSHSFFTTR